MLQKNGDLKEYKSKTQNSIHNKKSNQTDNKTVTIVTTTTNSTNSTNNNNKTLKSSLSLKHASFYDFKKIACIGKGSYGTVYLVQYKENKKYYAMKVLKKDMIKKLKQTNNTKTEREILERIQHPFIINLYYAFQNSDGLFMCTEFLQGGDLHFHLTKHGIFTLEQVRFYTAEIVLGLIHLHSNNIIYRDLKLENVLLDKDGHIKLIDFGLSKVCNRIFEANSSINEVILEKTHSFCGTDKYIAPEILLGKKYDSCVDWWSLGILIYEMSEGTVPFKLTKQDLFDDSFDIRENVTFVSCKSESMQSLILNLLEINCEKRLGYRNNNNFDFIKKHEFFHDINWDKIYNKELNPPFKPIILSPDDVSNFDAKFINESTMDRDSGTDDGFSLFPKKENDHYDNFSYDNAII